MWKRGLKIFVAWMRSCIMCNKRALLFLKSVIFHSVCFCSHFLIKVGARCAPYRSNWCQQWYELTGQYLDNFSQTSVKV